MQVKLKVLSGKNAGQLLPVAVDPFLIGREAACHLRPKSDAIAPRHCQLTKRDDGLVLADLGSATGTFVNGQKIEGQHELQPGDRLRVGPLEFEVQIEYELGGKKREKVKDIRDVAARTARQAGDRDEVIDSWLTEDEEQQSDSTRGSRTFSLDDIKVVKKEPESKPEEQAKKEAAAAKKKQFGKLPERPQQSAAAKDTREAASEMLKKLFKNK
jgi:pSer/pThr/pTyr-binding forkhead associated (FHA) protein